MEHPQHFPEKAPVPAAVIQSQLHIDAGLGQPVIEERRLVRRRLL